MKLSFQRGRAFSVALVLLIAAFAFAAAASPARAAGSVAGGSAVWPLQPRPEVVHGFEPPPLPWLAGHRGVDLAGSPGQPVLATVAGTITYAGLVAGRGVVVVSHGSFRTTYEPVVASVRAGGTVAAGEPVGRLSAAGSHCAPAACLHWGLRSGNEYRNPLTLLMSASVRLLPLQTPLLRSPGAAAVLGSSKASAVPTYPRPPVGPAVIVRAESAPDGYTGGSQPAGSTGDDPPPLGDTGVDPPTAAESGGPPSGEARRRSSSDADDGRQGGHVGGSGSGGSAASGLVVGLAAAVTVGGGLLIRRH